MTFSTTITGVITAFAKVVEAKVDQVHTLVNQQHTDMNNYQAALIRALESRGIEVPVDQSIGG